MATLVGATSTVIAGSGSAGSETVPKYRNYLEGANASGPATILQSVNSPDRNVNPSGTVVFGITADPVPVYVFPYVIDYRCTLKSLSINVTTAATSNWRACVYQGWTTAGDKLPNTLIADSGNVATNPASLRTATLNVVLNPGLYWFGAMFQNSAGSTCSVFNLSVAHGWGSTSAAPPAPIRSLQKTQNFGAFASTWGSTYTLDTTVDALAMWCEFTP